MKPRSPRMKGKLRIEGTKSFHKMISFGMTRLEWHEGRAGRSELSSVGLSSVILMSWYTQISKAPGVLKAFCFYVMCANVCLYMKYSILIGLQNKSIRHHNSCDTYSVQKIQMTNGFGGIYKY